MAEERRLVQQDRNDGLDFPPAARQLAKIAATRERGRPPSKPSSKQDRIVILYHTQSDRHFVIYLFADKSYKRNSEYDVPILTGQQATNSLGRKVGTWFTFGSNKKGPRTHQTS